MDWTFLVLLALAVPVIFLPPAFLLLRPTVRNGNRSKVWTYYPPEPYRREGTDKG